MLSYIKSKLTIHNYNFLAEKDTLIVSLNFGLKAEISFDDQKSYRIKGVFKSWNFLTGLFRINIEHLMLYNSIWLVILLVLLLFSKTTTINHPYLPFILLAWIVSWNLYYTVKYFVFKATVIRWIDSIKQNQ